MATKTVLVLADAWPHPDHLDALVAAPETHTLILENERTRVLHVHIRPGEKVPVHTHRWPAVLHIYSWSDIVRSDADGKVVFDSRTLPAAQRVEHAFWSEAMPPHAVENVGDKTLHVIAVELKR